VWVDVHTPNVHVEVEENKKISKEASYESWGHKDLYPQKKENNANSRKWAPPHRDVTHKDSIRAADKAIVCYHKYRDTTAFDIVVRQQQLTGVKDSLCNPLAGLISGGLMQGEALAFVEQREGRYADTDFRAWVLRS